tara:strand:+ start:173 stop:430 length:258 start_codon:yes stop_codon:yes gene_type:complete
MGKPRHFKLTQKKKAKSLPKPDINIPPNMKIVGCLHSGDPIYGSQYEGNYDYMKSAPFEVYSKKIDNFKRLEHTHFPVNLSSSIW